MHEKGVKKRLGQKKKLNISGSCVSSKHALHYRKRISPQKKSYEIKFK
jgi:hypothetical protein